MINYPQKKPLSFKLRCSYKGCNIQAIWVTKQEVTYLACPEHEEP